MNKNIKHLGMLYENILLELNRREKEMVKKLVIARLEQIPIKSGSFNPILKH